MTSRAPRLVLGGLLIAAFVTVLGLATGTDAATAKKARAAQPNPGAQVLVRVGREAITVADVQRRIDALPEQFRANYSTPEGRQQLLERMVEEKVWLSEATRSGVASRPAVKDQIVQQQRELIIRTYLNELMATSAAPSDSEANVYYEDHKSDYRVPATVTLRHIQTRNEAEAKRVKAMALKSTDWAGLAKKYSADTLSRSSGGSLGTVTRDGVFASIGTQPALAESAFAMKEGQVGGPVKTDRGWHVLKVESKKDESFRPFEQVKPVILRQLSSQRSQDFYKTRLEQARKTLGVTPDSAAIKGFVSQKKSARDLFNEAQAAGPAEVRVEAYRKLLADYPDSDVSPQAQFMIGFIYSEELKNFDEAEKAFQALLRRWPKAELAASARWMIDHMRSDDAPTFIQLDSDSLATDAGSQEPPKNGAPKPKKGSASDKP